MVKSISAARQAARTAQERLYDGLATVTEYQKVKDSLTGMTSMQEVIVLEDVPCRLSYQSAPEASQTESAASVAQGIKLFLAPEVEIKPGSKITVSQAGKTEAYVCSGIAAVYFTHQEIQLKLFEGWA